MSPHFRLLVGPPDWLVGRLVCHFLKLTFHKRPIGLANHYYHRFVLLFLLLIGDYILALICLFAGRRRHSGGFSRLD